ncbi:hypothetical protein Q4519_00230 [Motilimonas sp. 1_MG-2023]|uniref:hypothetical protein n=1 Tax=Motilimonas sp. 1_MG-2023 TaxID=3062672 RepID=UPI0026E24985|nr:hypothetical protein [Motilimonas sp. 1_MG-2023]MDO6524095.1 hypothetical protein [Motilimonas sp. 1_MG-2023]
MDPELVALQQKLAQLNDASLIRLMDSFKVAFDPCEWDDEEEYEAELADELPVYQMMVDIAVQRGMKEGLHQQAFFHAKAFDQTNDPADRAQAIELLKKAVEAGCGGAAIDLGGEIRFDLNVDIVDLLAYSCLPGGDVAEQAIYFPDQATPEVIAQANAKLKALRDKGVELDYECHCIFD